jgi:hypothetical protein
MEINLRKANAVQAEIRRVINTVATAPTVSVNEFTQNVVDTVTGAAVEFSNAVNRKAALTNALYNIRSAVAAANASAGVNSILTEVERIDALIVIENTVANQKVGMSFEEISARIEKFRAAPADIRSTVYSDRYSNVETSVLSADVIDASKQEIKNLRRQRQNLQDKLLSVNVNTLISISAEDEALLVSEGIL